jgi:hypothetical protein
MQDINEYICLHLSQRQVHLKLNEPCIDRGRCYSVYLRGLLAHILDTTLPYGMKIHACHACHNDNCCNPYHIYWGTPKENKADADKAHRGPVTIWERTIAKYGLEGAHQLIKLNPAKADL